MEVPHLKMGNTVLKCVFDSTDVGDVFLSACEGSIVECEGRSI